MKPVTLRSERLVLDLPVESDKPAIIEYCQDPIFERFLTVPWPYQPKDADFFVDELIPQGWESGTELTWALRRSEGAPLLGVLGWRSETNDVGYWLGAPHRGLGYMSEAMNTVIAYLFSSHELTELNWECRVGNVASLGVARKAGFRFTGEAPSSIAYRDGSHPPSWHGSFDRMPTEGASEWPA
jgi:RimJ/RimL family protein N-acetyltransferase